MSNNTNSFSRNTRSCSAGSSCRQEDLVRGDRTTTTTMTNTVNHNTSNAAITTLLDAAAQQTIHTTTNSLLQEETSSSSSRINIMNILPGCPSTTVSRRAEHDFSKISNEDDDTSSSSLSSLMIDIIDSALEIVLRELDEF
jgi:hypothetical protein